MNRRALLGLAAAGMLAVTAPASAQQTAVPTIGLLSIGTDPDKPNPVWIAFLRGLEEHGYVEGRNLAIERRFAGGNQSLLPQLVADLAGRRVALMVVTAEIEAVAAKTAMPTTPIVTMLVQDPVGTGLVASLANPGGTITGLTTQAPELYAKRLQLLREALPQLRRAGLLLNPDGGRNAAAAASQASEAASKLGLELRQVAYRNPGDLEGAFAAAAHEGLQALVVVTDGVSYNQRTRIAELSIAGKMPLICEVRYFADAGALMAYGPSYADLAHRAAGYVDRILHGANPADLPVEQPTTFELVINLRAARELGLTVPQLLLAQADEVIE